MRPSGNSIQVEINNNNRLLFDKVVIQYYWYIYLKAAIPLQQTTYESHSEAFWPFSLHLFLICIIGESFFFTFRGIRGSKISVKQFLECLRHLWPMPNSHKLLYSAHIQFRFISHLRHSCHI